MKFGLNPLLEIVWESVKFVAIGEDTVTIRCANEPARTFEFDSSAEAHAAFEEWMELLCG